MIIVGQPMKKDDSLEFKDISMKVEKNNNPNYLSISFDEKEAMKLDIGKEFANGKNAH